MIPTICVPRGGSLEEILAALVGLSPQDAETLPGAAEGA
jgi:hypothetical protein